MASKKDEKLIDAIADAGLWHWANMTADSTCDAVCRLNNGLRDRGTWWEGVEGAAEQVCWGCNQEPWPNERRYGHQIWQAIHHANLPIRAVAAWTNLWSVPCPRGIQRRDRGTRCLIGHFVYGIMCFFKWMGEAGHENFALTNLESVMDLAPIVAKAPCKEEWAFPVAEVSENYERILTLVWHRHLPIPSHWLLASGPLQCQRQRLREPQERHEAAAETQRENPEAQSRAKAAKGLEAQAETTQTKYNVQCLVLTIFPDEVERMSMVADTYAKHCDSLLFFTAGDAPSHFRGYSVVNLRHGFDISPDSNGPNEPNTIFKTFAAFHFAGLAMANQTSLSSGRPHVICRLDSDTLFLPENLRRILSCRNFSPSDLWAIGRENYAHKHEQPGRVFLNGGTGICLSRATVKLLVQEMQLGNFAKSSSSSDWNTGDCVVAPGHWDDAAQLQFSFHLTIPSVKEHCF